MVLSSEDLELSITCILMISIALIGSFFVITFAWNCINKQKLNPTRWKHCGLIVYELEKSSVLGDITIYSLRRRWYTVLGY